MTKPRENNRVHNSSCVVYASPDLGKFQDKTGVNAWRCWMGSVKEKEA